MTNDQLNAPGRVTNGPFTEREFFDEIVRMRELFGSKDFWMKPTATRQAAVDGLAYMYFRCETAENVAGIYGSTMSEYTRRETIGIMSGTVNLS